MKRFVVHRHSLFRRQFCSSSFQKFDPPNRFYDNDLKKFQYSRSSVEFNAILTSYLQNAPTKINFIVISKAFRICQTNKYQITSSNFELLNSIISPEKPSPFHPQSFRSFGSISFKEYSSQQNNSSFLKFVSILSKKLPSTPLSYPLFLSLLNGLKALPSTSPIEIEEYVLMLQSKIQDLPPFHFTYFCDCIQALQPSSPLSPSLSRLMNQILDHTLPFPESLQALSSSNSSTFSSSSPTPSPNLPGALSSALLGLQNASLADPPVNRTLQTLCQHISGLASSSTTPSPSLPPLPPLPLSFDSKAINSMLFGLKRISSSPPSSPPSSPSSSRSVSSPLVLDLLSFIASRIPQPFSLTNAFCGLQNLSASQPQVRSLLSALNIAVASSSQAWDLRVVEWTLNSLKNMSCQHQEVRDLLATIALKIREPLSLHSSSPSPSFIPPLDPRTLSRALLGLQRMKSETPEVRSVLSSLLARLAHSASPHPYNPKQLCNSLHALKCMINNNFTDNNPNNNRESPPSPLPPPPLITSQSFLEVKSLLRHLTHHLALINPRLYDSFEVSQLVYSLPNSSLNLLFSPEEGFASTHCSSNPSLTSRFLAAPPNPLFKAELDSLLLEVSRILPSSSPGPIKCEHIGSLLYGLRGLSSAEKVMQTLLLSLAPRLQSKPFPHPPPHRLQSQQLAMLLFGLNSMSSADPVVLSILPRLAHYLQTCESPATQQHFAMCLYGLQNLDSERPEVREILRVVADKLNCNSAMTCPSPSSCPSSSTSSTSNSSTPLISFPPITIALSLLGFSSFHTPCTEVDSLLSIVCDNIEQSIEYRQLSSPSPPPETLSLFTFPLLSRSLYGIQALDPLSPATQRLLRLLAPWARACEAELTRSGEARDVSNAFYGLLGMNLHVLDPLPSTHINTHTEPSLPSLPSLPSASEQWRSFLQRVFSRVLTLSSSASSFDLMFLHQSLLLASTPPLSQTKHSPFPPPPLLSTINSFSLQLEFIRAERAVKNRLEADLKADPRISKSLLLINNRNSVSISVLPDLASPPSPLSQFSLSDESVLLSDLKMLDLDLPPPTPASSDSASPASDYPREGCEGDADGPSFNYDKKTLEEIFALLARMAFTPDPTREDEGEGDEGEMRGVEVLDSVILHGFQADILLKFPRPSRQGQGQGQGFQFINVEVDGPYHRRSRKKRFTSLRDRYLLLSHDIHTVRLDLLADRGPWWDRSRPPSPSSPPSRPALSAGPLDDEQCVKQWFRSIVRDYYDKQKITESERVRIN